MTNTYVVDDITGFTCQQLAGAVVPLPARVGAVTAPALPASTVTYTNALGRDAAVVVSGGTVTVIAVDGQTQGVTSGAVVVPVGKTIAITYSAAPTWKWTLL